MSSSLIDRAVKHTAWNSFGSIGTLIVSVAFAGVALRYLGTARFGFVMLMQSVTGIIIDVGLGQAAIYYVARYYRDGETERIKNILGTVILVTVVIGTLVAFVLVLCVNPILIWAKLPIEYAEDARTAVFIYAINFWIIYGFGVLRIVPQAIERFDWFNITNLAQSMGGGILKLIVLLIWPTITALMLSMLITTVLTRTILFIKAREWLGFWIFPRWNRSEARNLWSFGKAVALNQAGGLMANTVGQWILVSYLGSSALPYFVIPRNMGQRIHGLLAGQLTFIFPMLSSELSKKPIEWIYGIYDKLQWIVVSFAALIYALLIVLANPILTFWLGKEFAEVGVFTWQICMLPYFFLATNIVPYYITYSINRPMANTVSAIAGGFGTVILSILLIPKYGVVGAAFSLWLAVPVSTIYAIWVGKAIFPDISWKRLLAPYTGSVILVVSVALGALTASVTSETVVLRLFIITGSIVIAVLGIWFFETHIDAKSQRIDTLYRAFISFKTMVGHKKKTISFPVQ